MKEILKKLNLIDSLTTQLDIQKNEFVTRLKENVDDRSTGIMSNISDAFSSSKNEYKGQVGFDNFKIKRKSKFFDSNMNLAVAQGTYRQKDNILIIETEINGFSKMMIPFYIFAIVFYSIYIASFVFIGNSEFDGVRFFIPLILIHAAFMFGIPYLMMRRSISRMKNELEKEFHYLTKN